VHGVGTSYTTDGRCSCRRCRASGYRRTSAAISARSTDTPTPRRRRPVDSAASRPPLPAPDTRSLPTNKSVNYILTASQFTDTFSVIVTNFVEIAYIFIFIHQAGSNINNNRKLKYKHLIKYYNLLQNLEKVFTVERYRNINFSCLLLRTQLGRSIAKQL